MTNQRAFGYFLLGGCFAALLLFGSCAGPAEASPDSVAYRWLDRHGTYCWTDDKEMIPEAYRAEARRVVLGKLADYPRYTKAPQVEKN